MLKNTQKRTDKRKANSQLSSHNTEKKAHAEPSSNSSSTLIHQEITSARNIAAATILGDLELSQLGPQDTKTEIENAFKFMELYLSLKKTTLTEQEQTLEKSNLEVAKSSLFLMPKERAINILSNTQRELISPQNLKTLATILLEHLQVDITKEKEKTKEKAKEQMTQSAALLINLSQAPTRPNSTETLKSVTHLTTASFSNSTSRSSISSKQLSALVNNIESATQVMNPISSSSSSNISSIFNTNESKVIMPKIGSAITINRQAEDLRMRLTRRISSRTGKKSAKHDYRMDKKDFLVAVDTGCFDIAKDIYAEVIAASKDNPDARYDFLSSIISDHRTKPANSTIWVKPIPGLGMMILAYVIKSNSDLAKILVSSLDSNQQTRIFELIRRVNSEITESQINNVMEQSMSFLSR